MMINNREDAIAKLRVGSRVKNLIEDILEVVEINGIMYKLKYVIDDDTLSAGTLWMVPSHFVDYEIVRL